MPNWCSNTLIVTGDKEELKKFKEFAQTEKDGKINVLDHEQFIPYPQKFKDLDKEDANCSFNLGEGENKEKDKDKLVDGLNGYDWCLKYYGTKWGICEPNLNSDDNDDELVYLFETAWSPPLPIIKKMGEMFKSLNFSLEFEESGCDFMGNFCVEDGEIINDETRAYEPYCDECEHRGYDVEYDEDKETQLCKECRLTELQKVVKDKLEKKK